MGKKLLMPQAEHIHRIMKISACLLIIALVSCCTAKCATCGDSLQILLHVHGQDTMAYAGLALGSLGDVNGDGFDDIVISSSLNYDSSVGTYLYLGGESPSSIPAIVLRGRFMASCDFDGDGLKDVLTRDVLNKDTDPRGVLLFYKGYGDSIGVTPYDSIYPAIENHSFGLIAVSGYVDSDSLADIVTCKPYTSGGPTLYYFRDAPVRDTVADWVYKINDYTHSIGSLNLIDFNSDGHLDLVAGFPADLDTVGYIYVFFGPNFPSSPSVVIGTPSNLAAFDRKRAFGRYVYNIGDVNGNGYADIGAVFETQPLIYFCGPGADTLYDLKLEGAGYQMSEAGDVNGDGANDLLVGDGRTPDGIVDVHLGGSSLDGQYDCSIYRSNLPPLFLDQIGWRLSAAGDFNGDGVADFMFACQNFAYGDPGDVFVIAGSRNIHVGVDERPDSTLPNGLRLMSNYPNPFNPETSIEFELPRAGRIDLEIFNTLGQKVATVAKEIHLSAGKHVAHWNGKLSSGAPAPSGVYFLRMTTEAGQLSSKMMLLK